MRRARHEASGTSEAGTLSTGSLQRYCSNYRSVGNNHSWSCSQRLRPKYTADYYLCTVVVVVVVVVVTAATTDVAVHAGIGILLLIMF